MKSSNLKNDSQESSEVGAISARNRLARGSLFIIFTMMVTSLIIVTRMRIGIMSQSRSETHPDSFIFYANPITILLTAILSAWQTINLGGWSRCDGNHVGV
jgi:hypothetical protein